VYAKEEFIDEEDGFTICEYPVKYDRVKIHGITEIFIKPTVAVYKMVGKDTFHICNHCINQIGALESINLTAVKYAKKYGQIGGTIMALAHIILMTSIFLRLHYFENINIMKMKILIL
jgi:hypothetical protein